MLIANDYLEFQSRGKSYRVTHRDVFQDNGSSILFFPNHKAYQGRGNPFATEVPKKEWKQLLPHLKIVPWEEVQNGAPLVEVKYYVYS